MQHFDILWALLGIGVLNVLLVLCLLFRKSHQQIHQHLQELEENLAQSQLAFRQELQQLVLATSRQDRDELNQTMLRLQQLISAYQTESFQSQRLGFESLFNQLSTAQTQLGHTLTEQFNQTVEMNARRMQEMRTTIDEQLSQVRRAAESATQQQLQQQESMRAQLAQHQLDVANLLTQQLTALNEGNTRRMSEIRVALDTQLQETRHVLTHHLQQLQSSNELKLEEMRKTVDEKLHDTLEKRVSESFKQVAERLELVHRGLGEMQKLAQGVGDLKHLLSNVKARGVFGEVQLEQILEQVFTPEQFSKQVQVNPHQKDMVDFAIALPGKNSDQQVCWLPIDAKFPTEDYERLLHAQQNADVLGVETAAKALEQYIKKEAKNISEKYISPPYTTDFAILFLPTEGLYAEVLRRQGLIEYLQRNHHIVVAGPTTILALLNSLQMGFRTLALEKRSAEVWRVLGAVKTEFGKFGTVLTKMRSQLETVSNTIDSAQTRTRMMNRALKQVESLPEDKVAQLLPEEDDTTEQ